VARIASLGLLRTPLTRIGTPLIAAALLSSCLTPPITTAPSPSASPTASSGPTRPRLELSHSEYALQTKGKIRVAVRDASAPYSARTTSGSYEGLEPDLAREIARAIWGTTDDPETHITWISVDDSTAISALTSNQADITLAALLVAVVDAAPFEFTDAYYNDGQRLLVKKTNEDIKELVDVASGEQTVAAVKGSRWEQDLRQVTNERAKVLPLDTLAFCVQALSSGAADAFTQDEATLVALAVKDPTFKVVAKQFTNGRLAIGVKKNVSADRQGFREFLNTSLLKIVADRTWAKVFEKWIGPVTGEKKQLPTD
jgi:ABC-type amino acid transport substrate-binding protein